MPPTPEPIPTVWSLKRDVDRLAREQATLRERIRELTRTVAERAEMDSSVDGSVHPGSLRLTLKNLPPWVYVAITVSVCLTLLGLFGPIQRGHGSLPEAASGLVPVPELPP